MHLSVSPRQVAIHIHAVFAGKQRYFVSPAHIAQGPACPNQLGGLEFTIRIVDGMVLNVGPAKIIHAADLIRVGPHCHQAPHRRIDAGGGHMVGINSGICRQQSLTKCQTF